MKITNVKIHPLQNSKALALVSITIEDGFVVTGLRILNGKNGLWVAMPSRKDKNGDYQDICFTCTKEAYQTLQDTVLSKYNETNNADMIPQKNARQQAYDSIDVTEDDLPFG